MARLQALRLPNRNRCCRKEEVSCGPGLQQETPDQLVRKKERFCSRKESEWPACEAERGLEPREQTPDGLGSPGGPGTGSSAEPATARACPVASAAPRWALEPPCPELPVCSGWLVRTRAAGPGSVQVQEGWREGGNGGGMDGANRRTLTAQP